VSAYAKVARRSTSTILARFTQQGLVQHLDIVPQAFYALVKDDTTKQQRDLFDALLTIIEERDRLEK
jgi:hypothetical protein